MSPLDDELRAALHGRAQALAPSPDPLAGIERRAKRIRRQRVGTAVAGSVLAVAAAVAAVPALQATLATPRQDVPRYAATPDASAAPSATYALDPEAPWPYRGDPVLAVQGDVEAYTIEWATRHGVLIDDVDMTLLFGQRYEPSATPEVVYLVTQRSNGQHWWGVAQATESGPELLVDQPLRTPAEALVAALPGDEVARLLVVASPEAGAVEYGEQGSEWRRLARLAEGVATGPLDAPGDRDVYRVLDRDGQAVDGGQAPDLQPREQEEEPTPGEPATALDPDAPWEPRGETALLEDKHLDGIGDDFATRRGIDPDSVKVVPLYVQKGPADAELEVVYLVRQNAGPWMWGASALFEGGWAWYAQNGLEPGTEALVATLPRDGDQSEVLVVSAPSNGGGQLAAEDGEWQSMQDLAPGVFSGMQVAGAQGSRYRVLDGDGDLDDPVAEGDVPPFQNAG